MQVQLDPAETPVCTQITNAATLCPLKLPLVVYMSKVRRQP